jgi:hypothetical protein
MQQLLILLLVMLMSILMQVKALEMCIGSLKPIYFLKHALQKPCYHLMQWQFTLFTLLGLPCSWVDIKCISNLFQIGSTTPIEQGCTLHVTNTTSMYG